MKIIKLLDRKLLITYMILGMLISIDNIILPMITENVVKAAQTNNLNLLKDIIIYGTAGWTISKIIFYLYERSNFLLAKNYNITIKSLMYRQFHQNPIKSETFQNILYKDVNTVKENYIDSIFAMFRLVFLSAVPLVYMFYLSVEITLAYLIFSIFPILISGTFDKKITEYGELASIKNEDYIKDINENISATKIIKHYLRMGFFKNRNDFYLDNAEQSNFDSKEILSRAKMILLIIYGITYIMPLVYGGYIIILGRAELSALVAIYMTADRAITPLTAIISYKNTIKSSKRIVAKIEDYIFQPLDDNYDVEHTKFELNNINFMNTEIGYDTPLYEINDLLKNKEKVLVIGESGTGKSSLFKTLFRDIKPIDGDILYKDKSIEEFNQNTLYKSIGYIPQEVIIFDESVEFNITLGDDFTKEEIYRALESSGLSSYDKDELLKREAGIDGSNLSGGEKARISIARALIRGYKILLVDEFSASLDKKVAKEIRSILLKSDITILEIAHHYDNEDLSLFDKIYEIKKDKAFVLTNE